MTPSDRSHIAEDDELSSVPRALSALCDGEADDRQLDVALAAWPVDAVSRRTWQDWQLVGDVLRSDELAAVRGADEAFLSRLRERIAVEPPQVLRPARSRAWPGRRLARWGGAALVAGVTALVSLGLVWQLLPAKLEGTAVASAFQALGLADVSGAVQSADAPLIRDARLDAYLRAHRTGLPTLPGGATGRFETVALER